MTIEYYEEEELLDKFPFCLATDEGLSCMIQEYIEDIQTRINNRDFEGIESMGQTLKELEAEREIRLSSNN